MKLSAKTLEKLTDVITGNSQQSPYRSGPQLIDFFHTFGERDLYGQSFPARYSFALEKLKKFNGTGTMRDITKAAFDFFNEAKYNPENVAEGFNQYLIRDGYRLVIEYGPGWMQGDTYHRGVPHFEVQLLTPITVAPETLMAISHEAVNEQIAKANSRIVTGDFSGAITSAYTLVEQLMKVLLIAADKEFNESEGDIRALYKIVRESLNLNPADSGIETQLRPILDGLQKLVGGLYEISNKASDRHARRYNPASHQAKLAVNAAFALCEFLVESHAYEANRSLKKAL